MNFDLDVVFSSFSYLSLSSLGNFGASLLADLGGGLALKNFYLVVS
jgi:hypothetical protein